ncbi:MAG: bifunctional uridylate/adenylate kinase [Thelocarpon impressellum]|nr:MAG: bifunctional uridylate/adenylate kinase [Thelocarpon impressellum]
MPISSIGRRQRNAARPLRPSPQALVRRGYAQGPNPTPGKSPFRVWPFVLIFVAGSWSYAYMVSATLSTEMPPTTHLPTPARPAGEPAFSPDRVTVIFVLGGPGAGKGTQCANVVREFGFSHLSAGDLLRAEQERPGSQYGDLIKQYIKEGQIVPMEVTVALLEQAMREKLDDAGKGRFLIDGFPRKMDQALHFESAVVPSRFTLFFDVPEPVMQERLLRRGQTSGRADDNAESIAKRFRVFVETSMPVVEYYEERGKVVRVEASGSAEEVYAVARDKVMERLQSDA